MSKFRVDTICPTCKHFAYNWQGYRICCMGMNVYEYDTTKCREYQKLGGELAD